MRSRRALSSLITSSSEADPEFFRTVLWSDEAIFKLNGSINRHNCVYWAFENPNLVLQQELNVPGIMVWAGICAHTIVGPYLKVNGTTHLDMLQNFKIELAESPVFASHQMTLQQDGAPAHFSVQARTFLNENFPGWIGRRGIVDWPPRSPDLLHPAILPYGAY
ncbi:unnamed protein product [Macrosiphum euphorbiae]|uniref:Transposase n=1 Tax=Macrosiphum euphorbiae TaxID=13131 RepID=A0AAV0X875_9HEMI|nr:unnamed protein product [Macrosiphum euphorbiae]